MDQIVKLQDVANEAGVSIATASRALAGKDRVSRETTEIVMTAAKKLGYSVDPIARAMREGITRTVGMIVPVIGNPFFAELVDAVEAELQLSGRELIIADSHGDVAQEARRLETLVGRRVDGILIVSQDHDRSIPAIRKAARSVPVVQVDRKVGRLSGDFVGVDNFIGMQLILDHMVHRGTKSVVLASSDNANSAGRSRRVAFEQITRELPLDVQEHIIGDFSIESGRRAGEELLRRKTLPDAVVAGSDLIAFGIMSTLIRSGVRIPDDLLVTGFDGTSLSGVFEPPLTTVTQPLAAIARDAAAFLTTRIADANEPTRDSRIAPTLVVRESA
ncbi:LacI family transcriptional regulator [Arthrobacter globiformis]|uniref:LacI family DNA-binding transcriptional regulator n=1 Tax=Arthrobacter globiformis TaxID=1665 RepID=UPI00278941F0|nr:LacI family DNA-binding transcriptional regulator [Arthrobacter globiformis]MDQ1060472.1 LacI family transcriptional regulator [Arthrobacter globiformis]